jgi:hypothetical protein
MLLRPAYLSQALDRPIPTKDGGTLRNVLDTRSYARGRESFMTAAGREW